jgi:hypothetical protein
MPEIETNEVLFQQQSHDIDLLNKPPGVSFAGYTAVRFDLPPSAWTLVSYIPVTVIGYQQVDVI